MLEKALFNIRTPTLWEQMLLCQSKSPVISFVLLFIWFVKGYNAAAPAKLVTQGSITCAKLTAYSSFSNQLFRVPHVALVAVML